MYSFSFVYDELVLKASLEPLDHAGLARGRQLVICPAVGEKAERARRRHARVLLAQRAGRGIARIGEDLLARRFLALVQARNSDLVM